MHEIDWTKPLELYDIRTGEHVYDAEVLAAGLKGTHPYVVRWTVADNERVVMSTPHGETFTSGWAVRNKRVVELEWTEE